MEEPYMEKPYMETTYMEQPYGRTIYGRADQDHLENRNPASTQSFIHDSPTTTTCNEETFLSRFSRIYIFRITRISVRIVSIILHV